MKTQNKRGFTIVELVVVIAIIAILAAVLIPTFSNLIKRANVSSDTQLIRNLNTALVSDSATNGKHTTMQSALDAAEAFGYDVSKINASATDNEILWDSKNDVFCYYNDETKAVEYIPETTLTTSLDKSSNEYWCIIKATTEDISCGKDGMDWSCYLASSEEKDLTTSTGIDVGKTTVTSITYTNSGSAKTVVIRTNSASTTLTIDDSSEGTIYHYGATGTLNIIECHTGSFHENGDIAFVEIAKGRIVLESGSDVNHIHVDKKTNENAFDTVIIAKAADVEMPTLSRDAVEIDEDGTLVVALQNGTEEITESTELDYVWLTKQGIYEQITVSASGTEAGTIWVNTSDKSDETKTAAQQIANNIGRDASGNVAATVTVSDTEYTVTLDENRDIVVKTTGGETVENSDIIASATTSAVEAVADKESVQIGATLFAGGTGTENDPFLVYDYATMQKINDFYTVGYYYFAVDMSKTDNGKIDCTGWKPINMNGSFDGKGCNFINLDNTLFNRVGDRSKCRGLAPYTAPEAPDDAFVKNCNIQINLSSTDDNAAVVWYAYSNLTLENINVSGYYQVGAGNAGLFVSYGLGTTNGWYPQKFIYKNCNSNATVINTASNVGILLGHAYCITGSSIEATDCSFTGIVSTKTGKAYFDYETKSGLSSVLVDGVEYTHQSLSNVGTVKTYTATAPALNEVFAVTKESGCTRAVASLIIGADGSGNEGYTQGGYTRVITDEEMIIDDDLVKTSTLKNYVLTLNKDGVPSKGMSFAITDNSIDIIDYRLCQQIGWATLRIFQYDTLGNVISVTSIKIK